LEDKNMFQMEFGGQMVDVCEHMKELKEEFDFQYIFGRFYNKKQLLKHYVGQYTFYDYDGTKTEEDLKEDGCGIPCGGEAVIGSRIGDYCVAFYKLEDIGRTEDEVNEVLFQLDWGGVFLKADDGQIYFINSNVD
jgi:hypothetical protein